ncbi:MAG: DUF2490 domain-containing protein [Bacteroidia bacterium]
MQPTLAQQDRQQFNNRILYTKFTFADFFNDTTKWLWELDVVNRRQSQLAQGDFYSQPLRLSIRSWIAYQATKLTRISFQPIGGFYSAPRFPQSDDLNRRFERELRTTLQINNNVYWKRVNFTHRMRFESRWRGIDSPDGVSHNFRVRYRIRTRIPLNTDYFYVNRTWYISQYSEMHAEFGRDYGSNHLSQNRNYLGVGYRFWDWARVELGYLHQYNIRGNNDDFDLSQGPMFYLFIDLMSKLRRN